MKNHCYGYFQEHCFGRIVEEDIPGINTAVLNAITVQKNRKFIKNQMPFPNQKKNRNRNLTITNPSKFPYTIHLKSNAIPVRNTFKIKCHTRIKMKQINLVRAVSLEW